MVAERGACVEAVDARSVRLQLAPACRECGGCGGRCAVLGGIDPGGGRIELPVHLFDAAPRVGDAVRLYLPEAALLRQARIGYGLPLAGLVAGAMLGHVLALVAGMSPNLPAVLLALLGTLTGAAVSKRAMVAPCRAMPVPASPPSSIPPPHFQDTKP